jgi:4-carboxymuconolactone decarboxylase
VHSLATQLLRHHGVDDALYAEAVAHFGEPALVDLVGCLGTFTAFAMLLNAFEVDLPPGASPAFPRSRVR